MHNNDVRVNYIVSSDKSRLTLTLLAFFLGIFGVDRFYAGRIGLGIFKLVTFGGFGIWSLIDFIFAITGSMKDQYGRFIDKWEK